MHQIIKVSTVLVVLICTYLSPVVGEEFAKKGASSNNNSNAPALMLANVYHQGIDLNQYWVSEKYDGVRALWDGNRLISRGGNTYHAPKWFIRNFPKQRLDGELWIGRQQFELVMSTVRDIQPDDIAWKKVIYMVFDMPDLSIAELPMTFDDRIPHINRVIDKLNIDWLQSVKQWKVSDHEQLIQQLTKMTAAGAEGLMLHRGASFYEGKRGGDLLKVKSYEDAEALVIGYIGGKGKYQNKMGALLVEMVNLDGGERKIRFKLGTGFSDQERVNPPKIGDMVTFKYQGKTKKGIPRFASFLRIRKTR